MNPHSMDIAPTLSKRKLIKDQASRVDGSRGARSANSARPCIVGAPNGGGATTEATLPSSRYLSTEERVHASRETDSEWLSRLQGGERNPRICVAVLLDSAKGVAWISRRGRSTRRCVDDPRAYLRSIRSRCGSRGRRPRGAGRPARRGRRCAATCSGGDPPGSTSDGPYPAGAAHPAGVGPRATRRHPIGGVA
jgi:hypothetical protein